MLDSADTKQSVPLRGETNPPELEAEIYAALKTIRDPEFRWIWSNSV